MIDVIERMLDAYTEAKDQDFSGTRADCRNCMISAAKVLLYECLKPVTDKEKQVMCKNFSSAASEPGTSSWDNFYYALGVLLTTRRSSIEKPITPEERVVVKEDPYSPNSAPSWKVYVDGHWRFGGVGINRSDAEIYRLGLIEIIKKEAK